MFLDINNSGRDQRLIGCLNRSVGGVYYARYNYIIIFPDAQALNEVHFENILQVLTSLHLDSSEHTAE